MAKRNIDDCLRFQVCLAEPSALAVSPVAVAAMTTALTRREAVYSRMSVCVENGGGPRRRQKRESKATT